VSRPARTADETNWQQIAALYDALCSLSSPVVELNRAMALAMAYGPWRG
jgi:predicted RNA polymerase sigma factor